MGTKRCRCAAASRSSVSASRLSAALLERLAGEPHTRSPVHRRAIPLALGRPSLSTSAAEAVRVLLLVQQARAGRSREKPRSGSRLNLIAVLPTLAQALRGL